VLSCCASKNSEPGTSRTVRSATGSTTRAVGSTNDEAAPATAPAAVPPGARTRPHQCAISPCSVGPPAASAPAPPPLRRSSSSSSSRSSASSFAARVALATAPPQPPQLCGQRRRIGSGVDSHRPAGGRAVVSQQSHSESSHGACEQPAIVSRATVSIVMVGATVNSHGRSHSEYSHRRSHSEYSHEGSHGPAISQPGQRSCKSMHAPAAAVLAGGATAWGDSASCGCRQAQPHTASICTGLCSHSPAQAHSRQLSCLSATPSHGASRPDGGVRSASLCTHAPQLTCARVGRRARGEGELRVTG